jgi:hypothetical protein
VTLEGDLAAFFAEHERCGEWDNVSPEDGARVVVTCSWGAAFNRPVDLSRPES